MIQITRQGNTLSGTFDDISLADAGATATTPLHTGFTGTLDGAAMTLSFSGTDISGTLSGDTMTLRWPQANGSIATLTLKPGSVDSYNSHAAAIRASAGANAAASVAADDRRRTESQIDEAANVVERDVNALRSANQTPDFSSFDHDLSEARKNLDQAKADAAKGAGETDPGSACYDASSAAYDASSVQYNAGSIDYDAGTVNGQIDAVNGAISRLDSDLTAYQQTIAALLGYTPANPPNIGAIHSLEDDASKAAAEWKTKAAQYQSQVAQVVSQANAVAAKAQKQYC